MRGQWSCMGQGCDLCPQSSPKSMKIAKKIDKRLIAEKIEMFSLKEILEIPVEDPKKFLNDT